MIFEIKSRNERLENDEIVSVSVQYSAYNEGRTVHVGGRFDLSAEEYKDKSVEDLKLLAKENLIAEVSAE